MGKKRTMKTKNVNKYEYKNHFTETKQHNMVKIWQRQRQKGQLGSLRQV
jgi:hypothetical protein